MKIQLWSDLHIEFGRSEKFHPSAVTGDVLVIAGDLSTDPQQSLEFLQGLDTEIPIIVVAGNHEFYSRDISDIETYRKVLNQGNIHFLENDALVLPEFPTVQFLGTTLWTSLKGGDLDTIRRRMNDFHLIRNKANKREPAPKGWSNHELFQYYASLPTFTVENMQQKHKEAVDFLVKKRDFRMQTVVVSHHAPSLASLHPDYVDSDLNSAYGTDLEEYIRNFQPVAWLHGHCHRSADHYVGKTRIVSNPHGYCGRDENPDFKIDYLLEI